MRKEMATILSGLRAIGDKGKLTVFGFTDDEIIEVIEEDTEIAKIIKEEKEKWKINQLTPNERAKLLISDGMISEENVWQKRLEYLRNEYIKASKRYLEEKYLGNDNRKLIAQKNRKKFDYELQTYRPDYDKRYFSAEEIERADSIEIDRFIKLDRRGFVNCPFHNEKTPSMHITKNMFFCFGCGEKGRTIKFIMKTQGLDFKNAVELLLK